MDKDKSKDKLTKRIVAFCCALLILLLVLLASGFLPGYSYDSGTNVHVFYPTGAEANGVSLFVAPPLSTLELAQAAEPLSLQFTNHTAAPATVTMVSVSPAECFTLSATPGGLKLNPGQSTMVQYQLYFQGTAKETCAGLHILTLKLDWKDTANTGQYTVSTGPIRLVSRWERFLERFFRLLGLVGAAAIIPIVLALITVFYQATQARRDEEGKERELRLDVWKAIFPILLKSIRTYYLPISRQMDLLSEEIGRFQKAPTLPNAYRVFENIVLLRGTIRYLALNEGGFFFRSKPGEELFGDLLEVFRTICIPAAEMPQFSKLIEELFPEETAPPEDVIFPTPDSKTEFDAMSNNLFVRASGDPTLMNRILRILTALRQILTFECDRPLYPEWYADAPAFMLTSLDLKGIDLGEQKEAILMNLRKYIPSLPKKSRIGEPPATS